MSETLPTAPGASAPTTITHRELWLRHWREMKLRAFEHRFYHHQAWEVKEGDLYTITRHGPMLYSIKSFGPESITAEHLVNDDGDQDILGEPFQDATWNTHDFQNGGFAACRLLVSDWIWKHYAKQDGLVLGAPAS